MTEETSGQLKLPPIARRSRQQSPFRLSNDNQVFKDNQSETNSNKRIWEKTTANHRNPLKRFNKFSVPIDQKYVPATVYGAKEKKLIQQALDLINTRKKNKDFGQKKQIIVDILEQKKEMFLVTMTHEIIDKQITNLKNQTNQRKKALEQSQQLLQNDKKQFQKHQQTYKQKNKQAEQQFQTQIKARKALQQQIKSQQIIVNSLRTQKTRNEQNINSYLKYKKFLDQLLPKNWVQQKQQQKQLQMEEIKKEYFSKWMQQTQYSNETRKSQNDRKIKNQKRFQQLLERQDIPQVLKLENQEQMFFKEPSQIIEFLNGLEETNLFCIQNSRMATQSYQIFKTQYQQMEKYLEQKQKSLLAHKTLLDKQLNEAQSQIRQMKRKKQQNNSNISEKDHKDLKNIIENQYNNLKDIMPSFMPEFQNTDAQPLDLLSCIEICMQKLLDRLFQASSSDPKLVGSIRVLLQKKKNTQKREQAALNKQQQQRRKSRNQNKKQTTVRIQGRIDMMRSAPKDKVTVKKVQVEIDPFENDRKYFQK